MGTQLIDYRPKVEGGEQVEHYERRSKSNNIILERIDLRTEVATA
jgi:hypothetical protein